MYLYLVLFQVTNSDLDFNNQYLCQSNTGASESIILVKRIELSMKISLIKIPFGLRRDALRVDARNRLASTALTASRNKLCNFGLQLVKISRGKKEKIIRAFSNKARELPAFS